MHRKESLCLSFLLQQNETLPLSRLNETAHAARGLGQVAWEVLTESALLLSLVFIAERSS